jgi:hypothetical protein
MMTDHSFIEKSQKNNPVEHVAEQAFNSCISQKHTMITC